MTDKEALQAFARNEELTQPTVKKLWRAGYIEVDDITTMDSDDLRVLKPMAITASGQKLMER